jgi:hypothetical protein
MQSYGESWYKIHGYAGKTVTWCPSDSEDRFDQNMANAKTRTKLEEYGWTRDNVSYTFNKEGFRADEFTDGVGDSVLFLGCSHTVGIGVDLESSWTYKVASSLGLRHYNLGIGAGSSDTCFRLAHHWIPRLRPKYVMMMTPVDMRIEMLLEKHLVNLTPNLSSYMEKHYVDLLEGFYNGWLSHPANAELNRLKNVMGVRTICNGIGVPLVEMPAEEALNALDWKTQLGRDLMHPGREWHTKIAERFLSELP